MSVAGMRIVAGVSTRRSRRLVHSITAASPRAFTSARIAATTASTSASIARLAESRAAKSAAKLLARVSSLSGIGGLAEPLDPAGDLVGTGLEGSAVDDEARGDVGDALDLDEPVRLERRAGLHEIDDLPAQSDGGREFHRAVELDALGLDAARSEMPARDLRVLGGDAHMAPPRRVVPADILGGPGHHQPAMPHLEIWRRTELRIFEFPPHVVAGDADMHAAD